MERWKAIVVGVDASAESARAVGMGRRIAEAAEAECRLIHVINDIVANAAVTGPPPTLKTLAAKQARETIRRALRPSVPEQMLDNLVIQFGWLPHVLGEFAADSSMLVLGGKHHSALGRWLAGSTVHRVLRDLSQPLLVAGPSGDTPYRIMAAVDLSSAAQPVLAEAQVLARLFRSKFAVLHTVEPVMASFAPFGPLPSQPDVMSDEQWFAASRDVFDQAIWPLVDYPAAEKLLRQGSVSDTIRSEAERWHADLLVVGSHGRGWTERLLTGSTTHQVLGDIPASVLIVPCHKPVTVPSLDSMAHEWL